jgi:hypothetical protein
MALATLSIDLVAQLASLQQGMDQAVVVPRAAGTVVPNQAMGGTSVTVNVAAGVTRGEVTAAVQLGMQTAEANMTQRLRAARVL